jgi:hypothetical protein
MKLTKEDDMENKPVQPPQGTGPQTQEKLNFPLRPGEQAVFITRWDGGYPNSIATFIFLGAASLAGLIIGDFWGFVGVGLGIATLIKLSLEITCRLNGRAVLTDQRILVRGIPSPFVSREVELKDVQELEAGIDMLRTGGGTSTLTVITRSGSKKGIVVPNASKIVEAYNAMARQ